MAVANGAQKGGRPAAVKLRQRVNSCVLTHYFPKLVAGMC